MIEQIASSPATEKQTWRRSVPLIPVLLGLLMVAVIGAFGYSTQYGVRNSRNWLLHSFVVRDELQSLETQLAEIRGTALAYTVSGDQSQLRLFNEHDEKVVGFITEIRRLTADNPRQQFRLGELESLFAQYIAQLEKTAISAAPRTAVSPEEAASIRGLDSQESQLDAIVRSMADDEKMLLESRQATWNRWFGRNALILGLTFSAALIFLAYNFRLLNREVSRTREMEQLQRESVRSSRALSARVLELQDSERRKIARELHDSVGQYLVGLKMNLDQLQTSNQDLMPVHAKLLAETIELTDRSIVEVRTISHLLHPPLLDEVGLESATRWYADGFAKRCGLNVNLQLAEIVDRLPKEVELALFRVLQESLTNVHRHANAKSIDIVLTCIGGRAVLTVHDDGRGISREVLTRFYSGLASGVGLAGMRERLAELGGALEVETRPRGSTVRATIPIMECAAQEGKPLETTTV